MELRVVDEFKRERSSESFKRVNIQLPAKIVIRPRQMIIVLVNRIISTSASSL